MKIGIYNSNFRPNTFNYSMRNESVITMEKNSIGLQAAILATLLVIIAGFILYNAIFITPKQQVKQTIQALGSHKWITIKPYLTTATINKIARAYGGEKRLENQPVCRVIDPINSYLACGQTHIIKVRHLSHDKVLVELEPVKKLKNNTRAGKFFCVLVYQNDRLKLDMPQTRQESIKTQNQNPAPTQ